MTRFVTARAGQRVLVMMPDGYRVWPDAYYDQYKDDASLFQMSVTGTGENGERVTVRGNHIARVQPAVFQPKVETPPLIQTPDGIPPGWVIYFDKQLVPTLAKKRSADCE